MIKLEKHLIYSYCTLLHLLHLQVLINEEAIIIIIIYQMYCLWGGGAGKLIMMSHLKMQ